MLAERGRERKRERERQREEGERGRDAIRNINTHIYAIKGLSSHPQKGWEVLEVRTGSGKSRVLLA